MRDPLRDPKLAYALADARERLMELDPRVTSVGIGYRQKAGRDTGELCVQVGVEEKLPPQCLDPAQVMPREIRLPAGQDDPVKVDVVPTGVLEPQDALDLKSRARPAVPGYSIGHVRCTAGTLGAVLTDRRRRRFILSNNHVLALENDAAAGDAILQPGPVDGGDEASGLIGRLHSFVELRTDEPNTVDCALAIAERDRDLMPAVHGLGTIVGPGQPELGMRVRKCGRTTGITTGRIRRVAVTARVHYCMGVLLFTGLFETGPMSAGGDSGSLLLDEGNRAVGLLFAGSPSSTLASPMPAVIDALELHDHVWF